MSNEDKLSKAGNHDCQPHQKEAVRFNRKTVKSNRLSGKIQSEKENLQTRQIRALEYLVDISANPKPKLSPESITEPLVGMNEDHSEWLRDDRERSEESNRVRNEDNYYFGDRY